jgi:hypothetical protein
MRHWHFSFLKKLVVNTTTTTTVAPTTTTVAPTTTTTGGFTRVAFVITSGSSRTVPTGATSMKAWVIGGGGGGQYDSSGCGAGLDGGYAGEAVKTYSVSGGNTITYSIGSFGAAGTSSAASTSGGNTTVTYGGVTITGQGGKSGDISGLAGTGVGGDFNHSLAFSSPYPADYQGRAAAVTLSGSSLPATVGKSGLAGAPAFSGGPGALVLYFT